MSTSTTSQALAGSPGGGLPSSASAGPRRSASVTVTRRDGDLVTVSTWDTCVGVAEFVSTLLGPPTAHVRTTGGIVD